MNKKQMEENKNKLHTITDEDAIEVAKLLLITSTAWIYTFEFDKIIRTKYDVQDGVDAEESVDVYFNATVKNDSLRSSGWKDERIYIKLVEKDRYHNYPYFCGYYKQEPVLVWSNKFLSNHIQAIEFLQSKKLI